MDKILVQYHMGGAVVGDILFFSILAAIGVGLGVLMGRYRLVALLASVYFASAICAVFPKSFFSGNEELPLIVFVVLVTAFTFLDEYLFDVNGDVSVNLWKGFVIGFFAVGIFISTAVSLTDWNTVSGILSKEVYGYLTGPWARVFWFIAPLVFLFGVKKKWR